MMAGWRAIERAGDVARGKCGAVERRSGFAAAGTALILVLVSVHTYAAGPTPDLGVLGHGNGPTEGQFAQVLEPRVFEFPRDHGPHPEYRQEWWYLTGNLDSAAGERFGFELTFFRFALAPPPAIAKSTSALSGVPRDPAVASDTSAEPGADHAMSGADRESRWRTRQIYLAHFAVTDVSHRQFRFAEKLSREALGLAEAQAERLSVWIGDWAMGAPSGDAYASAPRSDGGAAAPRPEAGATWRLHAASDEYELTLEAQPLLPPVLNGDAGLSRKSDEPGSASYYYSIPRVSVRGKLTRADGHPVEVQGLAWLDREWGSGTLGQSEQGWDWFALQMKDGTALMFYSLRHHDGSRDHNSAGTWVESDGRSRALAAKDVQVDVGDYWTNPEGVRYPARWRVRVPAVGLDVDVHPVLADQELRTSPRYWEGAVDVTGTRAGGKVDGRGYVELVGYAAVSAARSQ